MFFDSHAHLTDDALYPHLTDILARAEAAKLSHIVNICVDLETLERGIALHQQYAWVYNAAATTPHDASRYGEAHFEMIAKAAHDKQLVAIGETGLDYHYMHSPQEIQKQFLSRYLQLAMDCSLPVIIHCRDAFSDLFDYLDRAYNGPGVLHCFTGTLDEAKRVVERQFYLSLSGIVTFKKSAQLRQVAAYVPLDRLLIETDSPYLAPQRFRGQSNEPSYIVETAKLLAEVKGITLEQLAEATQTNARRLFGL